MKDIILRIPFANPKEAIIEQYKGDVDDFALQWEYNGYLFTIKRGGDTDGGSIPNILAPIFDPILDEMLFGYIPHDEVWRHRYLFKDIYKDIGMTFTESNRMMKELGRRAGASWFKRNTTRLGVRWGGWWKWLHPDDEVKAVTWKTRTLFISRLEEKK